MDMFNHMFQSGLQTIEEMGKTPGLCKEVRQKFEDLVNEAFESAKPMRRAHIERLRDYAPPLSSSSETCSCCFLRAPIYTLGCYHRLCASCTVIYGRIADPLEVHSGDMPFVQ